MLGREAQTNPRRARWTESLENLASVLETGINLREAVRPIMGFVSPGTITKENAAHFDLPRDGRGMIVGSRETVEWLARLPEEFMQGKSTCWCAGQVVLQAMHPRLHCAQLRAAIETVRYHKT